MKDKSFPIVVLLYDPISPHQETLNQTSLVNVKYSLLNCSPKMKTLWMQSRRCLNLITKVPYVWFINSSTRQGNSAALRGPPEHKKPAAWLHFEFVKRTCLCYPQRTVPSFYVLLPNTGSASNVTLARLNSKSTSAVTQWNWITRQAFAGKRSAFNEQESLSGERQTHPQAFYLQRNCRQTHRMEIFLSSSAPRRMTFPSFLPVLMHDTKGLCLLAVPNSVTFGTQQIFHEPSVKIPRLRRKHRVL